MDEKDVNIDKMLANDQRCSDIWHMTALGQYCVAQHAPTINKIFLQIKLPKQVTLLHNKSGDMTFRGGTKSEEVVL